MIDCSFNVVMRATEGLPSPLVPVPPFSRPYVNQLPHLEAVEASVARLSIESEGIEASKVSPGCPFSACSKPHSGPT